MKKKTTFLDSPQWKNIVENIQGIMMSDGSIAVLLDFERVLDEADIYVYKNWMLGELCDGPVVHKYSVQATFMWPRTLMPDPRGAKRLATIGCKVKYKKTKIKSPIQVESPSDFKPGTHYPKMIDRPVWLVNITIPQSLLNDIREGSVDIADQTINLQDLDDAYQQDYDKESRDDSKDTADLGIPAPGGLGGPPLGGLPF